MNLISTYASMKILTKSLTLQKILICFIVPYLMHPYSCVSFTIFGFELNVSSMKYTYSLGKNSHRHIQQMQQAIRKHIKFSMHDYVYY